MTDPTTVAEATYPAEEETEEVLSAEDAESEEQPELATEITEEGRYIPYSGGCMCWYENSGVLKSEVPNNYLFFSVMASDRVRSKQFQRFGERFNRRRGDQRRYKRMTGLLLTFGPQRVRGTTRDISRHGVRVQFTEEVTVSKGDEVAIEVYTDEQSDTVVLSCKGNVAWCEKVGKIRPLWNVGMTFEDLSEEQAEQLQPMLRG